MPRDDTDKLMAQLKKSMGGPVNSSAPLGKRGRFLGFASKKHEQVFRAVAAAHPKAVLIKESEWRETANDHVDAGYLNCAIHSHGPTYKLTESGRRRARTEKLIEDK